MGSGQREEVVGGLGLGGPRGVGLSFLEDWTGRVYIRHDTMMIYTGEPHRYWAFIWIFDFFFSAARRRVVGN